ncbi:unnamed protein product [Phytophthora fragariaefolia]|uniref:Unnamed protein product n=1 Tax=Phytophthora fragariaefolia TaxID=1490495 RepID=A0A9W6Y5U7_9STRA|nr:unnamed protein product [Phytophthora fragariaefolia]
MWSKWSNCSYPPGPLMWSKGLLRPSVKKSAVTSSKNSVEHEGCILTSSRGFSMLDARVGLECAAETPVQQQQRKVVRNQIRVERMVDMSDKVSGLASSILERGDFTDEDIAFMGDAQHFTHDPHLVSAYYYCCGVDPGRFVFAEINTCQRLASKNEVESTDILACALCGRIILDNHVETKVAFRRLEELHPSFKLSDEERSKLFDGLSEVIVQNYRRVYCDGSDIYYLIPELVRDKSCIPLSKKCWGNPRKSEFSVANGHDYGCIDQLPELGPIALDCISPIRCFGMDISISGKHSSGHTICFPSDGPSKIACVLPRVDPDFMPRVTFIGPEEVWRVQRNKFRALYDIPGDAIYKCLRVLGEANNIFRNEEIRIDDGDTRKRMLKQLQAHIEDNVHVADSDDVRAVHNLSTSERYGHDINEGCAEDNGDVVIQQSAVLPSVHGDGNPAEHGIIDSLLATISKSREEENRPYLLNVGADLWWNGTITQN